MSRPSTRISLSDIQSLEGRWTPDPPTPDLEDLTIGIPGQGAEVARISGDSSPPWESEGLGTVAGIVCPRQPSADKDLKVGSVAYDLVSGGSQLAAIWAHPNIGLRIGTGAAKRVGAGDGFEGEWEIQYFLPGEKDPEHPQIPLSKLRISLSGDVVKLAWSSLDGVPTFEGIGLIRSGALLASWAPPQAPPISFFVIDPDLAVSDGPDRWRGVLVTSAGARPISFVRRRLS